MSFRQKKSCEARHFSSSDYHRKCSGCEERRKKSIDRNQVFQSSLRSSCSKESLHTLDGNSSSSGSCHPRTKSTSVGNAAMVQSTTSITNSTGIKTRLARQNTDPTLYLTPTQRSNNKIKQLKGELTKVKRDLETKTKENVELRKIISDKRYLDDDELQTILGHLGENGAAGANPEKDEFELAERILAFEEDIYNDLTKENRFLSNELMETRRKLSELNREYELYKFREKRHSIKREISVGTEDDVIEKEALEQPATEEANAKCHESDLSNNDIDDDIAAQDDVLDMLHNDNNNKNLHHNEQNISNINIDSGVIVEIDEEEEECEEGSVSPVGDNVKSALNLSFNSSDIIASSTPNLKPILCDRSIQVNLSQSISTADSGDATISTIHTDEKTQTFIVESQDEVTQTFVVENRDRVTQTSPLPPFIIEVETSDSEVQVHINNDPLDGAFVNNNDIKDAIEGSRSSDNTRELEDIALPNGDVTVPAKDNPAIIKMAFLRNAIFYYMTDKENRLYHSKVIQSILNFSEEEKIQMKHAK